MTDIASLLAMVVQSAREREAATRLPHCIAGAQKRLDEACAALSDRIAVLEGERAAAIELCDTSAAQCPFNKGRTPPTSKDCPKCGADSTEPCREQVRAAFEAVKMLKLQSLTKEGQASG